MNVKANMSRKVDKLFKSKKEMMQPSMTILTGAQNGKFMFTMIKQDAGPPKTP